MIRKLIHILLLLTATAFILSSCDKVEPPFKDTITFQTKDTTRNVLLEEFTGHLCVNCPGAAEEVHNLQKIYGENLIVISVHAGFFAQTQSPPFDTDYTTTMGDALNSQFNVQSYPKGLVSRIVSHGSYKKDVSEWSFYVDSLINLKPAALIELSTSYNSSNRELEVEVSGTVLSMLQGDYNLSVVITEDSIVSAQKNNDSQLGPTPEIPDYVHMHMLRGAVNGPWGETYFSGPKDSLDALPFRQYSFTLDAAWDENNCHIIAFIYRSDNNAGNEYEVIQVDKAAVKN